MEIRPIFSALLRNSAGAILVSLQIAITLAIVVNAVFLVKQRVDKVSRPTGLDENNMFSLRVTGFGKDFKFHTMVRDDMAMLRRIPGVDAKAVDIKKCNNPTFSTDGSNTLAKNAPQPRACDKVGPVQCTTGTGGAKSETPTSNGGNKNNNNTNHSSGGTGNSANPASTAGTGTPTAGSTAGAVIDPDTGQVVGGTGGGGADSVSAIPVSLSNQLDPTLKLVLIIVSCALLLGLTVGPPLIARLLRGGRR